jgi:hypothetical protein
MYFEVVSQAHSTKQHFDVLLATDNVTQNMKTYLLLQYYHFTKSYTSCDLFSLYLCCVFLVCDLLMDIFCMFTVLSTNMASWRSCQHIKNKKLNSSSSSSSSRGGGGGGGVVVVVVVVIVVVVVVVVAAAAVVVVWW